jgi:hypothetical protein
MRTLVTTISSALLLAGCGGQSLSPADAGADASVGDAAQEAAPAIEAGAPDAASCDGCAPGLLCCNVLMGGTYSCIDPKTDPLDCGGCNNECGVNKYCGNGACAVPPCTSSCTDGLCCGDTCCAHGRICCTTDGGLQCIGGITCP